MRESIKSKTEWISLGPKTQEHSNNVLMKDVFKWTTEGSTSSNVQRFLSLHSDNNKDRVPRFQKERDFTKQISPSK